MVAVVPGHYLADYINFGDRFGPDLATGSGALSLRSNSSSFRGGHAYAEGAALHGAPPEHHNFKESRKAVTCGLVLPGLAIGAAPFTGGLSSGLLLLYPLNLSRISWRLSREGELRPWTVATFLMLAKFPEALGWLRYQGGRHTGNRSKLIEYKAV